MKILFIVNPAADHGKAVETWKTIEKRLKNEFPQSETAFTAGPRDATTLAKKALENGFDTVVSCGGDGTLNEIINGIVGSSLKLAVLPLGTGSDFGKSIGIRDFNGTISSLNLDHPIHADAALVEFADGTKRYFINSLEAGFGADVMTFVNSHKKFGKRSFLIGIVATLIRLKKFRSNLKIDDKDVQRDTIEVIIANGKYFGGGMLASPDSLVDDSYLDIHVLTPVTRLRTLLQLRELIDGSYIKNGHSVEFKGKSIELNFSGVKIETDGEVIGNAPGKISIIPGSVNLLVPQ